MTLEPTPRESMDAALERLERLYEAIEPHPRCVRFLVGEILYELANAIQNAACEIEQLVDGIDN